MKCISRSTLGVIIGVLNIVAYFVLSIGCIINIVQINATTNSYRDANNPYTYGEDQYSLNRANQDAARSVGNTMFSIILVICLVMVLISALLVVGIVKKRHFLMAPWIILSVIGFVCCCIRAVILLITVFAAPIPFFTIVYVFAIVCLVLGVEALILYPIYTLFRDIRNKNNERPGQTIVAGNVGYTTAYPVQTPYYTPIPVKA